MLAEERARWKQVETAINQLSRRLDSVETSVKGKAGVRGIEQRLKNIEERVDLLWKKVERLELQDPNRGKVRG